MTSLALVALVARPRLPVDHLETPCRDSIDCRCGEFLNTGLGGRGEVEGVCLTQSAIERFQSRIKETNPTNQRTDKSDINEEY